MSNPTGATVRSLLVNEANRRYGLTLQVESVQFSDLLLTNFNIIDLTNPISRNSSLKIIAGNPQDNGVVVDVAYNRLFLPKFAYPYSLEFVDEGEVDVYEFLPRLAARLNRVLDPAELVNANFSQNGEVRTAVLAADAGSLVFFGQLTITLVAPEGNEFLQTEEGDLLETEEGVPLQIEPA